MQRKALIAGNWKMYLSIGESVALARSLVASCQGLRDRDVMIAPAFTALAAVAQEVKASEIQVAAQNVGWEPQGAFTGEISPTMLKDIGVTMAIIGHSERRQIFGETDSLINQRIRGALQHGILPVFCLGETLGERESGSMFTVLERQIRNAFTGVVAADAVSTVVAYEPVWAIGTGVTASTEQAQEAHAFIRTLLAQLFEKKVADQMRILYGGSVKPENVDNLMAQPDIDGALVGGASLKAESFERIIRFQ